jgi:heme iron utilization protein
MDPCRLERSAALPRSRPSRPLRKRRKRRSTDMPPEHGQALRQLLQRQQVAALGTLHGGDPFVSMVPYALLADGAFAIHVSRLATHTKDMENHAGVSLLILDQSAPEVPPQALPRATLQGEALRCGPEAPRHGEARAAYLARYPESELMFGFADFSLFLVQPRSLRFVGGFAQAWSLTARDYAALMAAP